MKRSNDRAISERRERNATENVGKRRFFPSISSRISSFSSLVLPSFYSFSSSGLTNGSRFILFASKESFVLSFLFGRNHVTKDCTKRRQMAHWSSRKIRANASLQRMKKRLPNVSWTLVSRFSIRSSDHAHANVVHLYNDYICWLELNF